MIDNLDTTEMTDKKIKDNITTTPDRDPPAERIMISIDIDKEIEHHLRTENIIKDQMIDKIDIQGKVPEMSIMTNVVETLAEEIDNTTPTEEHKTGNIAVIEAITEKTDVPTAEIILTDKITDTDKNQSHLSLPKKCSEDTIARTRTTQLTGTARNAMTLHITPGIVRNII